MDPKIAKKTQDTLGKLIKKPPLTDKLLSKPPFRFLHDIMTSVIKTTGFMKGLYTEAEMNSDNVKDKDAKIAFLQKAIDMVATVTGLIVMAKPAKIVAGHEPERTNEFLQALASAINSKVDNDLYVKKVLSGGGGESRKEQGDKEERQDREKERTHSSSRKKDEDKHRKEDKERSRDHDKDREKRHRDRDDDGREEKDRERHRDQREKSRDKEERHKNRDRDKDRDKDRGRDRERERRKKNTEGSAHEVDKDLSGNAAMSELTSAHNNNPRESHLRSAEDSPPVGAKKSEQERQSLTKAANVHQRPSGDKKHTKKSGIAKELTPSDRLSGPKRSHKAGKNLEASTHQSNLESSLQSPTTSEKETPADSIRFLEKSFHQTSSFPTFPSGLEKQGSVHRKLRDSQQASRSSPPMVKQSSSSALSTVSGAASPKKPSKAPAAKRNRKSSSDSTDTNKASNKLKTELSLPQTNRSARESLHSSDVRSRAGISQDKLNTTITMRTVEEDCEDDILTSTDLVDKLVTNHDGDFKQIVSGSQMASSGASILQLNQSDLLATVQTDKAEISLPQLPVSESSPSLQPGKQIIDLTRKPKAVKLRNNSLRKSRTSSKIPMENHLTQAETGVDSAEIPQGKGSHFPAMGAGEDAGEIEEKSLMVKPSLSHFNLPSESSAKQCSSSTLLDSHHPQKEVEEKENESPGQNGEKDSPQGAPARQQRPTSAKGARRRRQGREAREEDDEEFLQKDNREPAISENDLPPQIAASRKMARPASARPAPPRPKQDGVEAEPAMRLGTGAPTNLIVDDGKQSEDEDENFLVEESAPPPPAAEHVSAQGEVEDDAEHGALVKKMLESKKEAEQQQQPTKKTEIERPALSDTQRRKQRELVAKEIERLQTSIQSLTRSANPLGKIMDYVQEDMDSMQKELDRWRAENKEHALALHRERNVTDRAIEPLKAQLADIDRAISDQLDLIAASKSSIIRNDNRIQKMLLSIARS